MNYPLMKPRRLTVDEFRELELNAPEEERWELIDGMIVKSMAGGTLRHNMIVQNVTYSLRAQLRRLKSPCRPYMENVRLDALAANLSTLPDVVVSCDKPDGSATKITDAALVVEVHSTASRAIDRGKKLEAYMSLPSVMTIILIEQETMSVVTHTRFQGGWLRHDFGSETDLIAVPTLGVELALKDIYEDVAFDQETPSPFVT